MLLVQENYYYLENSREPQTLRFIKEIKKKNATIHLDEVLNKKYTSPGIDPTGSLLRD